MFPFTLQQLRILKVLAVEKSFTKAAEVLYISQPALSQQIQRLEKNLNLLLINRENQKISLTKSGKIILDYSERILALSEECCRVLMDFQKEESSKLTIGSSFTLGHSFLPKIIELFRKNYPQIDLEIILDSTIAIFQGVKDQEIDLGFVRGDISKKFNNDFLTERFVEDEILLIGSNFYPFLRKPLLRKEDLYQLKFVSLNPDCTFQKLIDSTLQQSQIESNQFQISFQLNSIEEIKVAVKLGLGVAFLVSSTLDLETLKVIPLEKSPITQSLSIVYPPQSFSNQAFQFFYLELIRLRDTSEA